MSVPADPKLYNKIKKENKMKPSAYRSGHIVRKYKREFKKKYGNKNPYKKTNPKKPLKRWFNEKWTNQRGGVGYKFKSDIYRPTIKVTKDTPKTFNELSKSDIIKARRKKKLYGRVNKY